MNEEMQEQLAMVASFIDVPWNEASQQATKAHKAGCPTMTDIIAARAYMRVQEAKEILRLCGLESK